VEIGVEGLQGEGARPMMGAARPSPSGTSRPQLPDRVGAALVDQASF